MWALVASILVTIVSLCTGQPALNLESLLHTTKGRFGFTLRPVRDRLLTSWREKNYYHPHHGYEPYWVNGEWVIRDPGHTLEPLTETTTKAPLVCSEECDQMYTGIQSLCAAKSSKWWLSKCWYDICTGNEISDFTYHYQTFDTYCQFLDTNCRLPEGRKWGLLYMGECVRPAEKLFLSIFNNTVIQHRMTGYLSSIASRLDSVVTVKL